MLLPSNPFLAPDTTHHGGGAQGRQSALQDLRPKTLTLFHDQAFRAGYEVRLARSRDLGGHYAALDVTHAPPRVMGYFCQGWPERGPEPLLLVPIGGVK